MDFVGFLQFSLPSFFGFIKKSSSTKNYCFLYIHTTHLNHTQEKIFKKRFHTEKKLNFKAKKMITITLVVNHNQIMRLNDRFHPKKYAK